MTAHRRENLGKPLENIFEAIKEIVEKYDDVKVIYPIHYNPQVRECANKILGEEERVKLIDPLNVVEFHNLINISYMILTDSGGFKRRLRHWENLCLFLEIRQNVLKELRRGL